MKKQILLALQPPLAIEPVVAILENEGHEVTTAQDSTGLHNCLANHQFNLIILSADIIEPDWSRDTAVAMEKLQAASGTPLPPIIMVISGKEQSKYDEAAQRSVLTYRTTDPLTFNLELRAYVRLYFKHEHDTRQSPYNI
jgi:CheY-like chemotaxis protein